MRGVELPQNKVELKTCSLFVAQEMKLLLFLFHREE